jgi:hypothetical protein
VYAAIMWRVFGADPVPRQEEPPEEGLPYTFVNGEVADADQVNANFTHITDLLGSLESYGTELDERLSDLESQLSQVETDTATLQSKQGTIITRWGNATAPAGTTLVQSGFAYTNWDIRTGPIMPMVIQSGDPGATPSTNVTLLYPIGINDTVEVPGGISNATYIKGAVVLVPAPAALIWGTHTAPAGWSVVYFGYAFGTEVDTSLHNPGPMCIDSGEYDASAPNYSSTDVSRIRPLQIDDFLSAPGHDGLEGKYVKCAVIKKD